MHVVISVKDFKAIVVHAETLKTSVQAQYSFPTRPLQLAYGEHGMQCEFTLMTIGDYRGSSITPVPISIRSSPAPLPDSRPSGLASRQGTQSSMTRTDNAVTAAMPPPSQPASRIVQQFTQTELNSETSQRGSSSQKLSKPSPLPLKASLDPESLFLPANDDDAQWDEANYEDKEEETLRWDASASNVSILEVVIRSSHCLRCGGIVAISQSEEQFIQLTLSVCATMARRYKPANSPNSTLGRCRSMAII